MTPIYDLHCHSFYSDGILSPNDLVSRAKAHNVSYLALTDHDTTQGIAVAQKAAKDAGIDLIPGIEFSTQWYGRGIHIVGLNIDLDAESLINGVAKQENSREQRARAIAERLAAKGYDGAYEGAQKYSGSELLGRPHFAKYLVEIGSVKSVAQAFKRYLGAGKVGDVKQMWPDFDEVIGWIKGAGGVAVLAHPDKYDMTRTKLRLLTADFAEAGGEAIEVISGKQKAGLATDMQRIADMFGLQSTCGSDFHSPGQPWQELGAFEAMPKNARPVWEFWST